LVVSTRLRSRIERPKAIRSTITVTFSWSERFDTSPGRSIIRWRKNEKKQVPTACAPVKDAVNHSPRLQSRPPVRKRSASPPFALLCNIQMPARPRRQAFKARKRFLRIVRG
ncbi:hypothetical protein GWI33_017067, partial [Rhynchophorus ferrugineus]